MTNGSQRPTGATALSMMMFLQYAVWGVWLPYLASYLLSAPEKGGLGFDGGQVGWILGLAGSIGAVTAPFLAGQIADRFLNAEKYLGILLIVGGIANFSLFYAKSFEAFLALSIIYSVAYMPTLSLTNSIAFAHLDNPEKKFPVVRTWGTIGWIVASNLFPLLWLQTNLHPQWLPPFIGGDPKPNASALIGDCLRVSGVLAVLYGLWSMFALPKTPPTRSVESPLAFAKAFGLLKHPGFLVVTMAALPIAMVHQVYFIRTAPFLESIGFQSAHVGPLMSIGQFAEIGVLAVLGFFLVRLGYRWTIAIGALAFAARYAIFSLGAPETKALIGSAMVLHGFCYGFFFAGAYIYVERVAPKSIRHSAQTVFGIIILGVGPVLAGFYNEGLEQAATIAATETAPKGFDWSRLWLIQSAVAFGAAMLVALFFRPGILPGEKAKVDADEQPPVQPNVDGAPA